MKVKNWRYDKMLKKVNMLYILKIFTYTRVMYGQKFSIFYLFIYSIYFK